MLHITDLCTNLIGPITLFLKPSECIAILGASGSGKSLLLRAIADLDPNKGDISLFEQNRCDVEANIWRQQVALVPAESGWWGDYVREHFQSNTHTIELLKSVGLPDALDWEVSRLSTGERHRLAIARALQREPRALLLDEPTATLDDKATKVVEELIEQQRSKGVAILLVTHNIDQAKRLASRSLSLRKGRLEPASETQA